MLTQNDPSLDIVQFLSFANFLSYWYLGRLARLDSVRSHSSQDCPNINNPALLKNRVADIRAFKFSMASLLHGLETRFLHPISGNSQQFKAETQFLVRSPHDRPRTTVR
ncbi:hypothetical protein J0895_25095 [Phormidium pseudopriestleyi FRX01]|uniref:Uncharacterized protein n=1 Tax=Phormidium pseudopriestleyi FRX01 TaxID=1759528 RepID=A0ABS3FYU9_9CYAN|nr:hypothetical protein [Phormidium pseudopriestleyi]MBO0352300.1 hypothetical protein [Phormidium pseudopriestleyi FRX01]